MTTQRLTTQRFPRSGFTLLELVVTVTIVAILAGAAVPVTSKVLGHRARQATRAELQTLADAVVQYVWDTNALPAELADLLVDPRVAGWSGPYLPGVVTDELTDAPGYLVDAWSRGYSVAATDDVLTITSAGADGRFGTDADVSIDVNVTPVRRARTLDRLEVVNAAVRAYNAVHLPAAPLSSSWTRAYEELIDAGLMPRAPEYRTDAWGDELVADPVGGRPVVRIGSVHLMSAGALRDAASSWPRRR